MKEAVIENSATADINKVVTWQYDQSASIGKLADLMISIFDGICGRQWSYFASALDDANSPMHEYVLSVLGKIIGVPRFDVTIDDETRPVSLALYRKLVIGKFILSTKGSAMANYKSFLDYVFGEGVVGVESENKMDLSFFWAVEEPTANEEKEKQFVVDNWLGIIVLYPTGVKDNSISTSPRFWLAENSSDAPSADVHGGGLDESSFDWHKRIAVLEPEGTKLTFTVPSDATNNTVSVAVVAKAGTPILAQDGSVVAECLVDGRNELSLNPTIGETSVFFIGKDAEEFRFFEIDSTTLTGTSFLTKVGEIQWNIKSLENTFRACSNLTEIGDVKAFVKNLKWAFYGTAITSSPSLPDCVEDMRATFYGCKQLTSTVDFPLCCRSAYSTYTSCIKLVHPAYCWRNIIDATSCYRNCTGLTHLVPLSQNGFAGDGNKIIIERVGNAYNGCTKATKVQYRNANGVWTDVSSSYTYMPEAVGEHKGYVSNTNTTIRAKFTSDWGGTKA